MGLAATQLQPFPLIWDIVDFMFHQPTKIIHILGFVFLSALHLEENF